MKFLSKRLVLAASFLLSMVFILLLFLGTDQCYNNDLCKPIRTILSNDFFVFTVIFPIFLLISLITYPLKQIVFETWKKFAVWAVPVVLILTYIITNDSGSGGFFSMDFSLYYLAIVYGLFFLTSLTIIGVSAFRSRNKI